MHGTLMNKLRKVGLWQSLGPPALIVKTARNMEWKKTSDASVKRSQAQGTRPQTVTVLLILNTENCATAKTTNTIKTFRASCFPDSAGEIIQFGTGAAADLASISNIILFWLLQIRRGPGVKDLEPALG